MRNLLPKLKLVSLIECDYLFSYIVDGVECYTWVRPEDNKYRITLGDRENSIVMLIDVESKMGRDITQQISKQ